MNHHKSPADPAERLAPEATPDRASRSGMLAGVFAGSSDARRRAGERLRPRRPRWSQDAWPGRWPRETSSLSPVSSARGRRRSCAARAGRSACTVEVTSPTFTIGHRYAGTVDISHLDLYRFRGFAAAEWGDLEPYFDGAVVFVEWPEAGAGALPRPRASVRLEHVDRDARRIVVAADDRALLEEVAGAGSGLRRADVATSALVNDGEVLGERSSVAKTLLEDVDALLGRPRRGRPTSTRSWWEPGPAASRARASAWRSHAGWRSRSASRARGYRRWTRWPRERDAPVDRRPSRRGVPARRARGHARAGGRRGPDVRRQRCRAVPRRSRGAWRVGSGRRRPRHVPRAVLHAQIAGHLRAVDAIEPIYVRAPDAERWQP